MRRASLWVGLSLVVAGGCFEDPPPSIDDETTETTASGVESTTSGPCDQGTLGCACFPNGTCSAGLICNAGVCDPFDPSTTGTADTTTTAADESTTAAVDTGSTGEPETGEESSTGIVPMEHVLFTTSAEFSGLEVGGLAGADATCTSLGRALRDTPWVAVLQDSTSSLADRITVTQPVVNVQGDLLAADEAQLLSGRLNARPGYDETGAAIPDQNLAWTGSAIDHCDDWTSDALDSAGTMGLPSTTDLWLDSLTPLPCSTSIHLYCLSQPSSP